MKKAAQILRERPEVYIISGIIVAMIYATVYSAIVYGIDSSTPW
jgi:hypothetical protein